MLPSYISVTEKKKIKSVIEKFLKANLKLALDELVSKYSNILKLYPHKITIRKQKTRWGSCSSQGNVNFNLALIMVPISVLEYVVAHELCHLKHPNHSRDFWELVATIIPDYTQQQQWLKTHAGIIEVL
jgi:predicted metal-dependent hydrolase